MTDIYIRSGPTNSRARWHMVNPLSGDTLTWCSRRPTGPSTSSESEVLASPWSWCEQCTANRWAAIDRAVKALRLLAPSLLIESEREAK